MADGSDNARFFPYASCALFAVVLVGFAPTFYLRTLFDAPSYPVYVFAHGVLLTAWFAWFCLQTTVVAFGRVGWHRRLGVLGVVLAVPVALSGVGVALGYGPRLLDSSGSEETDATRVAMVVWGNLGMLVAFAGFVAVAVARRRRTDVHCRLMYLASVSLLPPALARIARNPFHELPEPLVVGGGLAISLLSLAMFDRVQRRRPHRATVLGGCALGASLLLFLLVGLTETGRRFAFLLA